MDQIIKLVQEKAGLSEDQARTAVSTVVDFLKDKLPAPIASQVDGVISGAGASGVLDQAGRPCTSGHSQRCAGNQGGDSVGRSQKDLQRIDSQRRAKGESQERQPGQQFHGGLWSGQRRLPCRNSVILRFQLRRESGKDVRQWTSAGFGNVKASGEFSPDPAVPRPAGVRACCS